MRRVPEWRRRAVKAACLVFAVVYAVELFARFALDGYPDGFVGVWRDNAVARAERSYLDKLIERRRAGIVDPPGAAFRSASVWGVP